MLGRWLQKAENIWNVGFRLLEIAIILAITGLGFYVCWTILGDTDMTILPKLGWSIGIALISGFIGWIAWSLMKVFGGGL